LPSWSDEKLIESCKAGNKAHARLLFERYKGYVWRLIWNIIRDAEITSDLTQDTFIRAFKGLPKFKGESSFKTWLSRIAVNVCRDHVGSMKRRHWEARISTDDPESPPIEKAAPGQLAKNPLHELLHEERKNKVYEAIDRLPVDHQITILLWIERQSYKEISKITNTSRKTVGTRIHYAKMKLRDRLKLYIKGKD
jgi:RNA polymerase sigma-70 factor (ECF subfamily)